MNRIYRGRALQLSARYEYTKAIVLGALLGVLCAAFI